jgi:hypothetical protein
MSARDTDAMTHNTRYVRCTKLNADRQRRIVNAVVEPAWQRKKQMGYTRPATWDDVKNLARELHAQNVEYALVDDYAIAAAVKRLER